MDNETSKAEKAAGFISGLLTGWGVPANWARVITGAIIGAVAAYVTLTQAGCTATYTSGASGVHFEGTLAQPVIISKQKH